MKVLILILTCQKNINRINTIRSMWINQLTYDYLFLYASKNIDRPIIYHHNLIVNCSDIYENLPLKMWLAYDYLYNHTNYDYIYKIDDDCIINVESLPQIINSICKNNYHYFGNHSGGRNFDRDWHFGKCHNPDINMKIYDKPYIGDWCGGGIGYILDRRALSVITNKKYYNTAKNELYEDKMIGDILRQNQIYPSYEYDESSKFIIKKGNIETLNVNQDIKDINTIYDIFTI